MQTILPENEITLQNIQRPSDQTLFNNGGSPAKSKENFNPSKPIENSTPAKPTEPLPHAIKPSPKPKLEQISSSHSIASSGTKDWLKNTKVMALIPERVQMKEDPKLQQVRNESRIESIKGD